MKKVLTFFIAGAAVAAFCAALGACANNDEQKQEDKQSLFAEALKSAPVELASKETLPQWLQEKINALEGDDVDFTTIWKGEWKGRVVYYYHNWFDSCLYCDVYFENGENINWDEQGADDADDFLSQSKNWVAIYQIGEELPTRSELMIERPLL